MGTLEPQNNGPLYSNTAIGILAADGWAVTVGTEKRHGQAAAPPSTLLAAVPNVTASVPTSYYSMWHYNYLCTVKG